MFCSKCGNEVVDDAVICPKCGCKITKNELALKEEDTPKTGMGILLGLLLGIIGLIIGLCLYKENTIARKTFLKSWGITFGICAAITVIVYIVYIARMNALIDELYSVDYYN